MDLRVGAGLVFLLAVVVLGVVCPGYAQEEPTSSVGPEVAALLEQGEAAMSSSDHREALKVFKKADTAAQGRSMAAIAGAASAATELGQYKRSETYARRLIELSQVPAEQARGYHLLGVSLAQRGSLSEAISALESALSLAGDEANAAREPLAEALARLGRSEEASRVIEDYFAGGGSGLSARIVACSLRTAVDAPGDPLTLGQGGGEGFIPPRKLYTPPPSYPSSARERDSHGVVNLQAVISKLGCVTTVKVVDGPDEELNTAASEAVEGWIFQPATLEGAPVPVYFDLSVTFRMSSSGRR